MPYKTTKEVLAHNRKKDPWPGNSAQAKFVRKHGEYIGFSGELLFANGAIMENTTFIPRMTAPPKDRWERAKNILQYWTVKQNRAKQAFILCKATIRGFSSMEGINEAYTFPDDVCVEDEDELLAHLEGLKRNYEAIKQARKRARRKVEELEPEWYRRAQQVDTDETEDEREARNDRIDSIKID